MRNIAFSLEAAKALRRHVEVAAQLCAAIVQSSAATNEGGAVDEMGDCATAFVGSRRQRIFIGDFSIIFEDTDNVRVVTKIGRRDT